jgi:hypothetical protein
MRLTVRQLLFYIAAFSVWLGCIGGGSYLLGSYGAVTFGALFGIAIVLVSRASSRWQKWSTGERGLSAFAILLSICGGLYLANAGFQHDFHRPPQLIRDANRLQFELASDQRFRDVVVSYEDPSKHKGEWLWVRGTVKSSEDLDYLHRRIDDEDKWFVKWEVVAPDG